MTLEERMKALIAAPAWSAEALRLLGEFRAALNQGVLRAASRENGEWVVHEWVKQGLLLHAGLGRLQQEGHGFELDTLPRREFRAEDAVRIPLGSWIRDGAYVGPQATLLPPVVVNIGAYIGRESVIDSHSLVGVCAQVGERVTVSSGVQIGGVVSPLDRLPNIIEDDVVIGGNCGIYDGVRIGRGATLAAGTVLTAQSRVYDLVNRREYRWTPEKPLAIPENAIVTPGARMLNAGIAAGSGMLVQMPVIVGYRAGDAIPVDLLGPLLQ